MTRAGLLGFYDFHPDILRQIEGTGEAFFEADCDGMNWTSVGVSRIGIGD
jgi:hypothetical protein